jgi:hypothetical protein
VIFNRRGEGGKASSVLCIGLVFLVEGKGEGQIYNFQFALCNLK